MENFRSIVKLQITLIDINRAVGGYKTFWNDVWVPRSVKVKMAMYVCVTRANKQAVTMVITA